MKKKLLKKELEKAIESLEYQRCESEYWAGQAEAFEKVLKFIKDKNNENHL